MSESKKQSITIEIPLTEAQVKQAVEEYLTYQMNQGKLWFARLNAGDFIETRGKTRRRIKGVGKGTADFIVIQPTNVQTHYKGQAKGEPYRMARVTFLECKSSKGKQSLAQIEFQQMIEAMNCHYLLVKSVDDLGAIPVAVNLYSIYGEIKKKERH